MTSIRPQRLPRLLAAVATGTAIAIYAAGLASAGPGAGDDDDSSATRADLPRLLAAYARAQRPADQFSAETVAAMRAVADLRRGEDPADSRRLETGGGSVYAWPYASGVCHSTVVGAACFPAKVLRERGVVLTTTVTSDSPGVSVSGLAVSGISELVFKMSEGASLAVAVSDNAVSAQLPGAPTRVEWVAADGTRAGQDVSIPRG